MPLQNRVDPFGHIHAVPERGLFMGNRGILHDDRRRLGRARWRHRTWIVCVTAFRGRKREVMSPRRYTELFFLDEATALAAGHRPCFECRREAAREYQSAFAAGLTLPEVPRADEMDRYLHRERTAPRGEERPRWSARVGELPDGVLVLAREGRETPHLVIDGLRLPWTFGGYGASIPADPGEIVEVLTPPSSVAAMAAGYRPVLHPSAEATIARSP